MTLSIVLRAGSTAQAIQQTLDSLAELEGLDYEIVVVEPRHDGDSLGRLLQQDQGASAVSYLALPPETRPGVCLNAAIRLAKGDYFVFLQAGTTVSPLWLTGAVKALRQVPNSWCYTAAKVRDTQDTLPPRAWPVFKKKGRVFGDILAGGISPQSAVLSRAMLQQVGGFDEDLPALVEEELLLRLAQTSLARYNDSPLVEVEQPQRLTPEALVARCYWMSSFLAQLERAGLKKSAFTALLEDIDQAEAWGAVNGYLSILEEDPEYRDCIQDYLDRKFPPRQISPAETVDVSGVRDCVGCGSCQGRCPVDAISMVMDKEGFYYPSVDNSRCVQCGLCLTVCPTQREELPAVPVPDDCCAVQAADDVRMQASSGGVFPLLARQILEEGGYVAGAVFDKDYAVRHVVSDRLEDIQAMQTSKYVQSSTWEVYPQIGALLEQGKTVLFTGTPCQVAALHAFLGKEYEGLYTMDVACHGVPSPGVFAAYLKEFKRRWGRLAEVSFRKKEAFGWSSNLYIRSAAGTAYVPKQMDLYMFSFLANWILRESCYHCQFKGMKYSDLTAADFWGIQHLDKEFEDGKGSSYLTINTEKGKRMFEKISGKLGKTAWFGKEIRPLLSVVNPCIFHSTERPAFRDVFFEQWAKGHAELQGAMNRAFKSLHFDVALILHWSRNFGNAMTNYALYTYLSKKRSVLAVDNCSSLRPSGVFRKFAKEHYQCSSDYFPGDAIKMIEDSCDALVVGSDQVWNRYFNEGMKSGTYYQLSFAGDKIRKVAYGASFGTKGAEPEEEKCGALFRRFHKIGVRERFGVDSCRELYGVEAEHVLDPVFLPEVSEYEKLAEQSKLHETQPFILAYILNPTEEKRAACLQLQRQLGQDCKIISICEPTSDTIDLSRHMMDFAYVQSEPTIEDFLYLCRNCRYVVTDSFHGTCFALIFQKNFMSFVNRQPDRFTVFQQFGDASTHIGQKPSAEFLERCLQPLDQERINEDLARERERSRQWLEDALS